MIKNFINNLIRSIFFKANQWQKNNVGYLQNIDINMILPGRFHPYAIQTSAISV